MAGINSSHDAGAISRRGTVIVTGSSGLIGVAVCNRLASDGYQVIGFDREGPPQPPPTAADIDVDVTSDQSVRNGLQEVGHRFSKRIASVVHLAAYYDFSGEPSPLYDEVTVDGTRRLLTHLKQMDFSVEQFIFSSTMLVHAPTQPGTPIDEDSPIEAKWDYPESKVETEKLLRAEHGDIPLVMLRVAGVYTDRGDSIPVTQQIKRIYEKQITSRVFPGDTSHGQSFVHLDDVVDAIARCVDRRHALPPELAMLIGEAQTLSYEQLQHDLGELIHGEPWETTQIPKAIAKTGAWVKDHLPTEEPFIKPWMIDLADDHYELDISLARDLLAWEPQHNLRDTLPLIVGTLKQDPSAFYNENKLGEPPDAHARTEHGPAC